MFDAHLAGPAAHSRVRLKTLYNRVRGKVRGDLMEAAARGGSLKEAWDAVRASCDPKFKDYAIYEHCLPFNVSRAYDEARGIDTPRIWTAERDLEMWAALQG